VQRRQAANGIGSDPLQAPDGDVGWALGWALGHWARETLRG
jgi:hypothetical protein